MFARVAILAGSTLFLLGGCAGTPTIEPIASTQTDTTVTIDERPQPTPPRTIADTSMPVDAGTDADPLLIGLYGEADGATRSQDVVSDGSSNLAQLTSVTEGGCFDPDIDRTGDRLVFASTMHGPTADLYVRSTTGRTLTQITADPADDRMPSFSPDGRRVAFTSNRAGNWDVYVTSLDDGRPMQITSDPESELHPTWSPDGTQLAYCRLGAQSGRWEIWTVDVDNPAIKRFLDYGRLPKWSPDVASSRILFQRARRRGSRLFSIWTVDVTASGEASYPTEIASATNAALINPSWSPDGSRIVFAAVVDREPGLEETPAQADLWVVDADGVGRTNLATGEATSFQPVWAPSGVVYFVSDRSGAFNVWSVMTGGANDIAVANADPGSTGQQP